MQGAAGLSSGIQYERYSVAQHGFQRLTGGVFGFQSIKLVLATQGRVINFLQGIVFRRPTFLGIILLL